MDAQYQNGLHGFGIMVNRIRRKAAVKNYNVNPRLFYYNKYRGIGKATNMTIQQEDCETIIKIGIWQRRR